MRAFAHAVGLGYRYVETDVHVTSDGKVVAFHDAVLDRLTDRRGTIGAQRWSEVRAAHVRGEPIPLLEELLTTWPELRVNIEPKHDAAVLPLARLVDELGAHDRVCIGSFSGARIAAFRVATAGRVCTSLGPWAVTRLRLRSWRLPLAAPLGDCVQVPLRDRGVPIVDRRFLAECHAAGMPVHVWTVNERSEMERLLDLGADGLMTDRPALLKEVLAARGLWASGRAGGGNTLDNE